MVKAGYKYRRHDRVHEERRGERTRQGDRESLEANEGAKRRERVRRGWRQ